MQSDRLTFKQQVCILVAFTAAAFAFRLLPYAFEVHESWMLNLWGASPVLATFLLSVSKCRSYWLGLLLPLAGYLVSDIVIEIILASRGLDTSSLRGRLVIYGYFLVLSQLGLVLRCLRGPLLSKLVAAFGTSLVGWTLFFLLSNFLIWVKSTPADFPYYEKTWQGLVECYTLAVPFFKNQLLFEPFFIVVLFGGYAVLEARLAARRETAREWVSA